MPTLMLTQDEASELQQAAVDALAGAIGRDDKELESTMASLKDRLEQIAKGASVSPFEQQTIVAALAALVLTPTTRRWLGAHDPKALAQADAVIEPINPDAVRRSRVEAAGKLEIAAEDELHALRSRLRGRVKFLKELKALAECAQRMALASKQLPMCETFGGHPESFNSFDDFAEEIAEWYSEQAQEWTFNPLGEEG